MDEEKARGPGRPKGTRVKLYPRVMEKTNKYLEKQAKRQGKSVHEVAAEFLDAITEGKAGK